MAKSLNRILLNAAPDHPDDLPDVDAAVATWTQTRVEHGWKPTKPSLLREGDNVKVAKNEVPTWSLTLRPASLSGVANSCDKSTPQCRKACVMETAGRQFLDIRRGRDTITAFAAQHPREFLSLITHEVFSLVGRGDYFGLRLNVGSDLVWEDIAPWLFASNLVCGYDYTKWMLSERDPKRNYRLTYSHNERWNDNMVHWYTDRGHNVAMVFDTPKHQLPDTWQGIRVIDGDVSDYRYKDPYGVIVGLAAKGAAKAMNPGGFVTSA